MSQLNDYQFVMIPQKLASCLDANCHKMLSTLIGLNSILANEDGWFYRSNADLQLDVRFSKNLVIATLDTLYQTGIIDIDCIGKGMGHRSNRIHINFESFKVYEQYSFNDIRNNPDLWINTVSYKNHYTPSYCKEIGNSLGKGKGKKVNTNTDTTDTINTIDTKENNLSNKEIKNDLQKMNTYEEFQKVPTCIVSEDEFGKEQSFDDMRNSFHYTYKTVKLNNDLKEKCFECCNDFVNNHKNLDYQLLLKNDNAFLTKYEIKIGCLSQSISSKTGTTFSKNTSIQLLKEYVGKEMHTQYQEVAIPA